MKKIIYFLRVTSVVFVVLVSFLSWPGLVNAYNGKLDFVFGDIKRSLGGYEGDMNASNYRVIIDGIKNNLHCNALRVYINGDIPIPANYPQLYKDALNYARSQGMHLYANPFGGGSGTTPPTTKAAWAKWIADYANYYRPRYLGPFNEAVGEWTVSEKREIVALLKPQLTYSPVTLVGPDMQQVDQSITSLQNHPGLKDDFGVIGSHNAGDDSSATGARWTQLADVAGKTTWSTENPRSWSASNSSGNQVGVKAVVDAAGPIDGLVIYLAYPLCMNEAGALNSKGQAIANGIGTAPNKWLTISNVSPLPDGWVSTAYSVPLTAANGTTPYIWTVVSGSLPAGLSLSSGGVISGLPTTTGTRTFRVRVTDAELLNTEKSFTVTVNSRSLVKPLSLSTGAMPILTTSSGFEFSGNQTLSGTLSVRVSAIDYLIVGGGGGGGSGSPAFVKARGAGGGGGGGVVTGLFNLGATSYTVTVGAGGAGGLNGGFNGSSGGTSSMAGITSASGGGGGIGVQGTQNGGTSGSPTAHAGGAGDNTTYGGGGGGGGAGGNGSGTSSNQGANGGVGLTSSITGAATYYGGGGGGADGTASGNGGLGGNGGGGDGAIYSGSDNNFAGQPGTANTGGGGGGGRNGDNGSNAGGAGGAGVVVVHYYGDVAAAAGGTLEDISVANGNYYRQFTASGALSGLTTPASQWVIFSGNLSGASATLAKDGAGTLILTGNNSYGPTTISAGTLQIGANTATGSLGSGNIVNNATLVFKRNGNLSVGNAISGAGTLKQVGIGTLTLTGANSYTGATTVSNGTLQVNGSLASAVTVTAAGTLGGTGTLTGAVTVNGTLAPGHSTGTLTIRNNVVLANTTTLSYELGATSDRVSIVGNLTLDGTLDITDAGGFGLGTYTLFTYTGTLTNRGLAIGTTPNPYYRYELDTNVAGQVRLVVTMTFSAWQMESFGCTDCPEAALTADSDSDGLANLLEYALGLDPTVADPNPIQFDRTRVDANTYLRLSVSRDPNVTDVLIEGLSASNLVDWSTATTVIESNTPSYFRVRDAKPIETNNQRFLKLRFSLP